MTTTARDLAAPFALARRSQDGAPVLATADGPRATPAAVALQVVRCVAEPSR